VPRAELTEGKFFKYALTAKTVVRYAKKKLGRKKKRERTWRPIIRRYGETGFVGETEICFRVRLFKDFLFDITSRAHTHANARA